MQKSGFRRLAEDYILLLKLVGEVSLDKVAEDLSKERKKRVSEGALRGRLARGRRLISDAQWFLNNVYTLQKSNKRIRKFSISAQLDEVPASL